MIDNSWQAADLREQLDRELASVQASSQARDRLRHRMTAGRVRVPSGPASRPVRFAGRSRVPGERPRLRPALAVPFAAALVVLAVVAIPTLLRAGPADPPPTGGTAPAGSGPAPATSSPGPTTSSTPVASPTARPVPARTTSAAARVPGSSGLTISASPAPALVGRPVEIVVTGYLAIPSSQVTATPGAAKSATPSSGPSSVAEPTSSSTTSSATSPASGSATSPASSPASGSATSSAIGQVNWGDGTTGRAVPDGCGRAGESRTWAALSHTYSRPGRFRIVVRLDGCRTHEQAELTLVVAAAPEAQSTPWASATPAHNLLTK